MRPAVAETHSAVLCFIGDRAYKLKKPVDLGFLDFRTREAREAVCHREVELNRRLAPDVYLGVADVIGPDGQLSDHLVVMRRLPVERKLTVLVRDGKDVEGHLWQVAHQVATLHARSPRSPEADRAAGLDATRGRWSANTDQMLAGGGVLDRTEVERVQHLADRYIDGRGPLFAQRVADGRAVDGHGDLLADDVFCLDDGPRVLDCIEFDDALRLGDGLADAAFLAMDLAHVGRPDLGEYFLDAYRQHADDVWPASLAHHQVAYRAQVRAKVTAIRAEQGHPEAGEDARSLLALAADRLARGRIRVLVVGGLPGTGKSTLAMGLAGELGAVLLRSDEIRKELAGLPADRPAPAGYGEGIYGEGATHRTYTTMLERASIALGMGESVVLDASWSSASWREQATAVAAATASDLVGLRCDVPAAVAADRIRARAEAGGDPSDATPATAAAMAALADPWPQAVTVDTSGPPADALDEALRHSR